jgi:4-diphosphocytidyl-2-C-methyl-D-erythritol kinase
MSGNSGESTGGAGGGDGGGGVSGDRRSGRDGSGLGRPAASGAKLHIVRFAPAKLNLTLAVVGNRNDGYHALHSIFVRLSLGDALTVSTASIGASRDSLRVTGLTIPTVGDNLVLKAIAAARSAVVAAGTGLPELAPLLSARLSKRIPVAAGLGGGSSDAAAAIGAALAMWRVNLDAAALAGLAASLGSDVPFFLAPSVALITGRGEFVEPLPDIAGEPPAVLLVTPQLPLATAAVFKAYAQGSHQADEELALTVSERLAVEMRSGISSASLLAQAADLAAANDLRRAAFALAPGLRGFVTALEKVVERPVCQSGSGPTLWALYKTLAEARKAARFVRLAVVDGKLPLIGVGEPFIAATTIAGRLNPPVPQAMDELAGAIGPRAVHN